MRLPSVVRHPPPSFGLMPSAPVRPSARGYVIVSCVLVAVISIALLTGRRTAEHIGAGIDSFASLLTDVHADGVPVGPDVVDGPTALPALEPDMRAVRLGAFMADLDVAALARNRNNPYYGDSVSIAMTGRDAADARVHAAHDARDVAWCTSEIMALLAEVRGMDDAASYYAYVQAEADRGATISFAPRELARRRILEYHGAYVAIGNWLEAARIAAIRGDTAFFAKPEIAAEARISLSAPHLGKSERAALERVDAALHSRAPGRSTALLEATLTQALRTLAN